MPQLERLPDRTTALEQQAAVLAQEKMVSFLEMLQKRHMVNAWPSIADWNVTATKGPEQDDGSACGFYTLLAADLVVRAPALASLQRRWDARHRHRQAL